MEELPAKQHLAGFWPFQCQVKEPLTRVGDRHSRASGNPCQQKMQVPYMFTMGSRFRGNDAAADRLVLAWRQLPDLG